MHILNIYAPATRQARLAYFRDLAANLSLMSLLRSLTVPIIIVGDFNYDMHQRNTIDPSWSNLLSGAFHDCFEHLHLPTFVSITGSRSLLDYILCSSAFSDHILSMSHSFVNYSWTDHALLTISYRVSCETMGKGSWKGNPFLAKLPLFREGLTSHIQDYVRSERLLDPHSQCSAQTIWDSLKAQVKKYTRSFQLDKLNWQKKTLKRLQAKRNRILRDYKHTTILSSFLPTVEALIGELQLEIAFIDQLKAGKSWREHGEKSAGHLKRAASSRAAQRIILALQDPRTEELVTSTEQKSRVMVDFYNSLYHPDRIYLNEVHALLDPVCGRLTPEQANDLMKPLTWDEILGASHRSPRKSSPGSDGLPYDILGILSRIPCLRDLVLQIYNEALTDSLFPESWLISLMTLLPKKGDLNQAGNYRPIQLVNTDNKIFTRIINQRIMTISSSLINPHQLGFMPGRYIAEHGLLTQMMMENAAHNQRDDDADLGLLLDQEKAYDRVNLDYLSIVLRYFGFPFQLVDSLSFLFRENQIRINLNGWLSSDLVCKRRGLKQGDPISCTLYNFALEPLLQTILQDGSFSGYRFRSTDIDSQPALPAIKLLSYADDTMVFLRDHQDLLRLRAHLDSYCKASNAKINFSKVRALSLSGLTDLDIHKIWNSTDSDPIIYLGYPLIQSLHQRNTFFSSFIGSLKTVVDAHSNRNLSILGRATVANALILSKC
ncbi:Transposon TX1 uncharacterized protein, partial [Choanephora cucurbitarum]